MEVNTEVWAKDRIGHQSWLSGRVHSKVLSQDGKTLTVVVRTDTSNIGSEDLKFVVPVDGESDDLKLRNPNAADDEAENLVTLPYLHEPAILFCI